MRLGSDLSLDQDAESQSEAACYTPPPGGCTSKQWSASRGVVRGHLAVGAGDALVQLRHHGSEVIDAAILRQSKRRCLLRLRRLRSARDAEHQR